MDIAVIRQALLNRPFRTFVMRLNDGREYVVKHPEWVYLEKRSVAVGKEDDSVDYLEPVLIASLTIKGPPSGPATE